MQPYPTVTPVFLVRPPFAHNRTNRSLEFPILKYQDGAPEAHSRRPPGKNRDHRHSPGFRRKHERRL